jgi:hypothetical protein
LVAPRRRALLPDLGTVDIRSASPDLTKPLACRVLSLSVIVRIIIERGLPTSGRRASAAATRRSCVDVMGSTRYSRSGYAPLQRLLARLACPQAGIDADDAAASVDHRMVGDHRLLSFP